MDNHSLDWVKYVSFLYLPNKINLIYYYEFDLIWTLYLKLQNLFDNF